MRGGGDGLLLEERSNDANDFVRGAGFTGSFVFVTSSSRFAVGGSWWGADDVLVLELRGEPGVGTSVIEVAGVVEEPVECDWDTSFRGGEGNITGCDPTYRPVAEVEGSVLLSRTFLLATFRSL